MLAAVPRVVGLLVLALHALALAGCDDAYLRTPTVDAAVSDGGSAFDAGPVDADTRDAATDDAAVDGGAPPDGGTPATGPRVYPHGARHSPLDEGLAAELAARAAAHPAQQDDVLAKVGDSITVSTSFLRCFAGSTIDLAGRDGLAPTIDHFRGGNASGTDPFTRTTAAAGVGWTASRVLEGSPSPLETELGAITPRFAVVMYGTNDVGFVDYDAYGRNMTAIVDTLLARGIVPVLSSIPPRDDDASADARVPAFGGIVRALAASRGVPFVDFHRELVAIPGHGLASDGIHPQQSPSGACVLTPAGLAYAANVRNLITLEALDRLRRVMLAGEPAPDAAVPRLAGSGTRADPFVIESLPLAVAGDTRVDGERGVPRWDACSPSDESGPELRYRVALAAPARLVAVVSSGAGADLDVHLVRAGEDGAGCLARGNRDVALDVPAGSYDVVVDTYASGGVERVGEHFLFVDAR